MKKHWVEFHARWQSGPMTHWVHRAKDESRWYELKDLEPPPPPPFRDKGYAMFHIELDGVPFRFASLLELRTCIEVFSRKVLPTTAQIMRERGFTGLSNHVWPGRLPKKTHSLRYREKALPYLRKALSAFEKEVPNQPSEPTHAARGSPLTLGKT